MKLTTIDPVTNTVTEKKNANTVGVSLELPALTQVVEYQDESDLNGSPVQSA